MRIQSVLALTLVYSLIVTGCKKGEEADERPAPAPDDGGGKGDKDGKEQKKNFANSGISGLFAREAAAPTYAWDGQSSSITLDMSPNETYRRSVAGLRAMGFVIKDESSKKESGKSHIQGAKTDQTQVSVWIEEAVDKPGKTLIHVKVGALGDRTGSERVLDEIQKVRTRSAPVAKPAPTPKAAPSTPPPTNSQQP